MDLYSWMRVLIKSEHGRPDRDAKLVQSVNALYEDFKAKKIDFKVAKEELIKKFAKYPKIIEIIKVNMQDTSDFEAFCEALHYTTITSDLLDEIPSSKEIMDAIREELAKKDPEGFLLRLDEIGYAKYREYEAKQAEELTTYVIKDRLKKHSLENDKIEEIIKILNEANTIKTLADCLQEFERRAGQKRKKRAGGELEDDIKYLLDVHGIQYQPASYVGHAEFDICVPLEDGRIALISSKRTVRERWKEIVISGKIILQVSIGEDITYDKAKQMKEAGIIVYTKSEIVEEMEQKGLDNIRKLSDFIKDLKEEFHAKRKSKQSKLF